MTTVDRPEAARRITIREPHLIRALAHPARVAILEHLQDGGTATATECAGVIGLSPSATSYHLREMAKVGLIEPAPSRGDGRERVWRSVEGGVQVSIEAGSDATDEQRDAARDVARALLDWDHRTAGAWLDQAEDEPPAWLDVIDWTHVVLRITAAELAELQAGVQRLLDPYRRGRRGKAPPDARTVTVMFRAVPVRTGSPEAPGDAPGTAVRAPRSRTGRGRRAG
jgi:DNA-binding transcriptional ArsR family regulator